MTALRHLPAVLAFLCLVLPAAETTRAEEGDAVAGKKKAIEICARCHVIGSHNPYGGINSTPSFWIMQEKPHVYDEKLLSVTNRRPHIGIGLDQEVTLKDLEDILSYVHTLRRP